MQYSTVLCYGLQRSIPACVSLHSKRPRRRHPSTRAPTAASALRQRSMFGASLGVTDLPRNGNELTDILHSVSGAAQRPSYRGHLAQRLGPRLARTRPLPRLARLGEMPLQYGVAENQVLSNPPPYGVKLRGVAFGLACRRVGYPGPGPLHERATSPW